MTGKFLSSEMGRKDLIQHTGMHLPNWLQQDVIYHVESLDEEITHLRSELEAKQKEIDGLRENLNRQPGRTRLVYDEKKKTIKSIDTAAGATIKALTAERAAAIENIRERLREARTSLQYFHKPNMRRAFIDGRIYELEQLLAQYGEEG